MYAMITGFTNIILLIPKFILKNPTFQSSFKKCQKTDYYLTPNVIIFKQAKNYWFNTLLMYMLWSFLQGLNLPNFIFKPQFPSAFTDDISYRITALFSLIADNMQRPLGCHEGTNKRLMYASLYVSHVCDCDVECTRRRYTQCDKCMLRCLIVFYSC